MNIDSGWLPTTNLLQDRLILPTQDCIMSYHARKMVFFIGFINKICPLLTSKYQGQ